MTLKRTTLALAVAAVATPLAAAPAAHASTPQAVLSNPSAAVADQPARDDAIAHRGRLNARAAQKALDAVVEGGAIGAVAAVRSPEGRWRSAAGLRESGGAKARAGDKARVGSVTKSMVATVALQLVEEGNLRLDSTVDDVTPGLVPGHGEVTLEQLLSHRSGMPDYLLPLLTSFQNHPDPERAGLEPLTDEQLVEVGLSQKWLFTPGSDFSYSNTGYIVIGLMVEKATGKPIERLVQKRVFDKAGMKDSSMPTDTTFPKPHLTEYMNDGKTWIGLPGQHASWFGAAGSVVSTPSDLNRFYRALFTGTLLKKSSLKQMTTPRTTAPFGYGLGLMRLADPCDNDMFIYGHNGATFGTMSDAYSTPDGRTQAAASLSGRVYTLDGKTHDGKTQQSTMGIVQAGLAATCSSR